MTEKRRLVVCISGSRFSRQSHSYFLSCATYVVKWLCNLFRTPPSIAPSPIHIPHYFLRDSLRNFLFHYCFRLLLVLLPRDYSYQFLWVTSYRTECNVLPITVRSKWLKVGIKIKIARDRHRSWEALLARKHVCSITKLSRNNCCVHLLQSCNDFLFFLSFDVIVKHKCCSPKNWLRW